METNDSATTYGTCPECGATCVTLVDGRCDLCQQPLSKRDALSLAILALNTIAHPDATSGQDMDYLEFNYQQAIITLAALRDEVRPDPEPEVHAATIKQALWQGLNMYRGECECGWVFASMADWDVSERTARHNRDQKREV